MQIYSTQEDGYIGNYLITLEPESSASWTLKINTGCDTEAQALSALPITFGTRLDSPCYFYGDRHTCAVPNIHAQANSN